MKIVKLQAKLTEKEEEWSDERAAFQKQLERELRTTRENTKVWVERRCQDELDKLKAENQKLRQSVKDEKFDLLNQDQIDEELKVRLSESYEKIDELNKVHIEVLVENCHLKHQASSSKAQIEQLKD